MTALIACLGAHSTSYLLVLSYSRQSLPSHLFSLAHTIHRVGGNLSLLASFTFRQSVSQELSSIVSFAVLTHHLLYDTLTTCCVSHTSLHSSCALLVEEEDLAT